MLGEIILEKDMNRASKFTAAIICVSIIAGAAWTRQTRSRPIDSLTSEEWAADLDFLISELPKKHKNLYFKLSEERFQKMAEELRREIPSLTREQIQVGFKKILAAVGDAHTDTYWRPERALPLMLYWFDDGIFILNTTDKYKEALYTRITAVGGKPIEQVVEKLRLIIPHENEAQVKNKMGSLLTQTDILFALGITPDKEETTLDILDKEGVEKRLKMAPISMTSRPDWLVNTGDTSEAPLYRQRAGEYYWYHFLEDSGTLFFKYNACRPMKNKPFSQFTKEVFECVDQNEVRRMVIDLRHNGGGNSGIFNPFLKEIKNRESLNKKGRLFVLIGRRTFSSAVLNAIQLKNQAAALYAGEPSGGKPNHFGEIKVFQLPNSKLPIQYSTKYFTIAREDTPSLIPDIPVRIRFQDYLDKKDPVLEAVISR